MGDMMKDIFLEVMDLQKHYSAKNTEEMSRRGNLIRTVIKAEFSRYLARFTRNLGPYGNDIYIQGRDGTGKKTLIPWVRISSKALSPSAQNGWYLVFLFTADGSGVYICISHGSTELIEGSFVPRPAETLNDLVMWCRRLLRDLVSPDEILPIALGGAKLSNAYEQSTAIAKFFSRTDFPEESFLIDEISRYLSLLRIVYDAVTSGAEPSQLAPDEDTILNILSGHRRSTAQGFGLSPAERKAVETYAMGRARMHFEREGWKVSDVSAKRPYDLDCKKGGDQLYVEVKGTTSTGSTIILTNREKSFHINSYPSNVLYIVHSINLDRRSHPPKLSGGVDRIIAPWDARECDSVPIAFKISV